MHIFTLIWVFLFELKINKIKIGMATILEINIIW